MGTIQCLLGNKEQSRPNIEDAIENRGSFTKLRKDFRQNAQHRIYNSRTIQSTEPDLQ